MAAAKPPVRPGFTFLVCPDGLLLKEEIERRIAACKPDRGEWKRQVFWGDEEPDDPFWGALGQVGLFSENRVLIIRQAESWPAQVWRQLSSALAAELGHVWPFFCLECDWDKGKPKLPACVQKARCFNFAEKKGWIWRSPGLGQNLKSFVARHARDMGLVFEPDALIAFCGSAPADASGVLNELKKLVLLTKDGKIDSACLSNDAAARESDAFGLIRRLTTGDLAGAWREVAADTDGNLLFFATAILAREFRLLWQILAGEQPRMPPAEVQRKRAVAKTLGFAGIGSGMAELANAEWQVKSGRQTPRQTLENLCVCMCALFGRK